MTHHWMWLRYSTQRLLNSAEDITASNFKEQFKHSRTWMSFQELAVSILRYSITLATKHTWRIQKLLSFSAVFVLSSSLWPFFFSLPMYHPLWNINRIPLKKEQWEYSRKGICRYWNWGLLQLTDEINVLVFRWKPIWFFVWSVTKIGKIK